MLYEVIVKRLGKDFVCKEINRYIPETRNEQEESVNIAAYLEHPTAGKRS